MSNYDIEEGNGDPSQMRAGSGVSWIHVPARGSCRLVILSHEAVQYRSHWLNGRMQPHKRVGCPCEKDGCGTQPRWVWGVYDLNNKRCGMVDLPAHCAEVVVTAAAMWSDCRGIVVDLRKPDGTLRGRIECAIVGGGRMPVKDLPESPDCRRALLIQWQEDDAQRMVG